MEKGPREHPGVSLIMKIGQGRRLGYGQGGPSKTTRREWCQGGH